MELRSASCSQVNTFFTKLRERLRESYWVIPAAMGSGAVILAAVSLGLETEFGSSSLAASEWIYTRDASGARELLSTIGGSLITVTGVVFSVTLVALTNASTQFGTRILRTFARDTGNKVVLGAFLGTFLYCLLIMRTITGGPDGFVPHLSVIVGIALSMLCFALLIYFIHHVIRIVQADNVVTALSHDLNSTVDRVLPQAADHSKPAAHFSQIATERCTHVPARSSGYLESIDIAAILKCAQRADTTVEILCSPGDFVFSGAVLAHVGVRDNQQLADNIARAFNLESERSYVQDLEFAFQQLVLVGIRSLSPAINDQLLAMTCVDRLCESLEAAGQRRLPAVFHTDSDGKLRVIVPSLTYSDIVRMAFSLMAEVSRENAAVTAHILEGLGRVLIRVQTPELRAAILSLAEEVHSRSVECLTSAVDRNTVEFAYNRNFNEARRAA